MKYKVAVKGIIRREGGEILIVKRSVLDSHKPEIWETVGGGMAEDASPQEALKREVKEEVGLEIEVGEPFNIFTFINDLGEKKVGITFICEYLSGEVSLSSEHSDFAWINPFDFRTEYESIESLYAEIGSYANKFSKDHERFVISQKAVLIKDNKCLLAEINKRPGTWDLPGGRIDIGENKEEAFRREMREELGIKNFEIISLLDYKTWYTHTGFAICGIVSLINTEEEINLSIEHSKMMWVSEEDLDHLKFIWPHAPEMIKKGFQLARLKKAL